MTRKFTYCLFLLFLCSLIITGCSSDTEEDQSQMTVLSGQKKDTNTVTPATSQDDVIQTEFSTRRGSTLSVTEDGSVKIDRITRSSVKASGGSNKLTVFVYMCGADLESEGGLATTDVEEMINATSESSDISFIVCCDGASEWYNDICQSNSQTILGISGGEFEVIDTRSSTDMGDPTTLYKFLADTLPKYSSDNNGLVFWNHGGGSITGVCFDEKNNDNSLSLKELDQALASVNEILGRNFNFIGFDACLMGSVETANTLVPYADYMIGSEEIEVGEGWDYTAFASTPVTSQDKFYKSICDGFYAAADNIGEGSQTTLSVIKLSKIDDVIKAFDEAAAYMYSTSNDYKSFGNMLKGIHKVANFGGNNDAEGYTNMVDLLDLINIVAPDYKQKLQSAIDSSILYKVNGSAHSNVCGLSVYYPLQIQGSSELKIFKDICISPNYFLFIDSLGHGSMGEDVSSYENDNLSGLYWDNDDNSEDDYWSQINNETYHVNNDGNMVGEVDSIVQITNYGYMNDSGQFSIKIAPSSLDYVDDVQFSVFTVIDDYAIYLGSDDELDFDFEKGIAGDNFDGYWIGLPDNQPLEYYLDYYTDDNEVMFTSPIELNGAEMNLKFAYSFDTESFKVIGATKPEGDSGMKSRKVVKLKAGDKIVPLYDYFSISEDYTDRTYGDSYTITSTDFIDYVLLPEGDYLYNYEVIDIFGVSEYSDFVTFTIDENGEIYYSFDNESYADENSMDNYTYEDGFYWWEEDGYCYAYDEENDLLYMYDDESDDLWYWNDRYEEWELINDSSEYDDYNYLYDYYDDSYDDSYYNDYSYDYDYDYNYDYDDYSYDDYDDYGLGDLLDYIFE